MLESNSKRLFERLICSFFDGFITSFFGGRLGMISGGAGATVVVLIALATAWCGISVYSCGFSWSDTVFGWDVQTRKVCSSNTTTGDVRFPEWLAIIIFFVTD